MPWNRPADTERIRHRLGFTSGQKDYIDSQMDIAEGIFAESVTTGQTILDELDSLDGEIATSALEIDHLTQADEAKFISGGRTRALVRRRTQLIRELADILLIRQDAIPYLHKHGGMASGVLLRG